MLGVIMLSVVAPSKRIFDKNEVITQKTFYEIDSRGPSYKTFYGRNLHILLIS
jgi:hypothetical protein